MKLAFVAVMTILASSTVSLLTNPKDCAKDVQKAISAVHVDQADFENFFKELKKNLSTKHKSYCSSEKNMYNVKGATNKEQMCYGNTYQIFKYTSEANPSSNDRKLTSTQYVNLVRNNCPSLNIKAKKEKKNFF